jgi:hypothetical protein
MQEVFEDSISHKRENQEYKMNRTRFLDSKTPGVILTGEHLFKYSQEVPNGGYWLIKEPSKYITTDLVHLGVDKVYLNAEEYDRFVFWPDFKVAGTVKELYEAFSQLLLVKIGELKKITHGNFGITGIYPISPKIIYDSSLDPLKPDHQHVLSKLSKNGPRKARVGVVPYTIHNKNVYFLVGKNIIDPTWKSSGLYTDFGGEVEKEETLLEAAAREAYEESMGFLGSIDSLLEKLSKTKSYEHGGCILYPLYIKYKPEIMSWPMMYDNVMGYISKSLDTTFLGTHTSTTSPEGYYEKIALKWIDYKTIMIERSKFIKQYTTFVDRLVKNL